MNKIMYEYSYTSITLRDALKLNPDLLENLTLSTTNRTKLFQDMFKAYYNSKSIAGETVELSKLWIEDTFNVHKDYYENILNEYEKELDLDEVFVLTREHRDNGSSSGTASSNSNTDNIDLPNKPTTNEYVSDRVKNNASSNNSDSYNKYLKETVSGNVNTLEQREKALKFIRNYYLEFVKKFDDCFAHVYA